MNTDLFEKLDRLKSRSSRIIGCFPLYPPLALFYALDLVPVVLWGLWRDIRETPGSDRHLQNYACSVARHMTELLLSEAAGRFDGLFMYNACDTLRNLPEMIERHHRQSGRPIPFFRIHVPMMPPNQMDAADYLKNEVKNLIQELEVQFETAFSTEKFLEGIGLYRRLGDLFRKGQQQAASGVLEFSELADAALDCVFMPVADQVARLEKLTDADGRVPEGPDPPRVILSGIRPPPSPVLSAMASAGLRVAGNDLALLHRSHADQPGPEPDPAAYYVKFYRHHYPCPTLLFTADRRPDALIRMARANSAAGVIFVGEKFCEYEYFEFPLLEKKLKAEGLLSLQLEIAMEDDDHTGAHDGRVRAFGEMLWERIQK